MDLEGDAFKCNAEMTGHHDTPARTLPIKKQFNAGAMNRRGGIFPPPEILSPILMRSDLRPLKLGDSSESGKWMDARWPHARSQEWE